MPQTPDAETVRRACLEAARAAYEDAGFAGMCEEGRWERALDAIRSLDLAALTPEAPPPPDRGDGPGPDAP